VKGRFLAIYLWQKLIYFSSLSDQPDWLPNMQVDTDGSINK